MNNADVFVCINVLIQHFYDWVAFNDTLPHTLVSWQSLSIMAQSFQMLFYMWEGNKMFCMSQIFLKHFQMLIQYTAWNRMDAISASDELESFAKLWLEISVYWLSRHSRQTCRILNVEIIVVYANGHNVIRSSFQAAEIHSEAVHPDSCQFVRASRCRFALTWRADDLTSPRPPPSPPH